MTLTDLKSRPEFVMLTPKQKAFTTAYCSNGADKVAAARTAYPDLKDEDSATATANRCLRQPQIALLVKAFYNRTDETGSKSEALAIIWKRIQAQPEDLLDYLKLYGEWKGFNKPAKPEGEGDTTDYSAAVAALKED